MLSWPCGSEGKWHLLSLCLLGSGRQRSEDSFPTQAARSEGGANPDPGTQEGQFEFVPNDPSKPSYTGHFTSWGGFNTNRQSQTGTFTFSGHGKGSDGSTLRFHDVEHFTVGPNGVKVEFEKFRCG